MKKQPQIDGSVVSILDWLQEQGAAWAVFFAGVWGLGD